MCDCVCVCVCECVIVGWGVGVGGCRCLSKEEDYYMVNSFVLLVLLVIVSLFVCLGTKKTLTLLITSSSVCCIWLLWQMAP